MAVHLFIESAYILPLNVERLNTPIKHVEQANCVYYYRIQFFEKIFYKIVVRCIAAVLIYVTRTL